MSDFISRADAIIAIKSLYPQMPFLRILHDRWMEENKPYIECERAIRNLPPAEYFDEIPASDFSQTAPVVKGIEEAIALLNAINGEGRLDYAAYSELHDVITGILPEEEANK